MGAAGNLTSNSKYSPAGIKNPLPTTGKGLTNASGQLTLQGLNNLSSNVAQIQPQLSASIGQSMNPTNPGVAPFYAGPSLYTPPAPTPTPPKPQDPIIQQPTPPQQPPPFTPPPPPPPVYNPIAGNAITQAVTGGGVQGSAWGPLAGYFSALQGGR